MELAKNFRPAKHRVLVQRVDMPELVGESTLIVTPEEHKQKTQIAKVITVGPGRQRDDGSYIPMPVKVGDIVFINKWAITDFAEEYSIVNDDDILGVFDMQQ